MKQPNDIFTDLGFHAAKIRPVYYTFKRLDSLMLLSSYY